MRKKRLIILIGIVMCCTITACGTETSSDNESKQADERDEWLQETEEKTEPIQNPTYNLSYDIVTDAQNGLLYYTEDGELTTPDGNVIPEYNDFYVRNGYVIYGGAVYEGCYAENGKIVYRDLGAYEYSDNYVDPMEMLRNAAFWANCNTEVITRDGYSKVGNDGSYFDEVVLGAWFNEDGSPIADNLPEGLFDCLYDTFGPGYAGINNLKFIDGTSCTIDEIKRTSGNQQVVYAFILTDIQKRGTTDSDTLIEGMEYSSSTPVIVHGRFSKILNGDKLLVFAKFNGLAYDDTPNFQGAYLEIINNRF